MIRTICTFLLLVWLGAFIEFSPYYLQTDLPADTDSVQLISMQQVDADEGSSSDLALFIGRFHPVFVHLPIGFLLFAFLLEFASMMKRYEAFTSAVPFALLMGGLSGIAAGVSGYLLSGAGGYGEDLLATHQWLGISVVILSFAAWLMRIFLYNQKRYRTVFRTVLVVLVVLVMGTGHYGGSLTHGADYLFRYMPESLRSWINVEIEPEEEEQITLIEDLDQAVVYDDIIEPILRTRCQSCHNPDRTEGELLMTSFENLKAGGENGPVVVEHQSETSELYNRLLLPERDDNRMPPRGRRQLTSDQIKLIGWWIEQGLPHRETIAELEISDDMEPVLEELTVDGQSFFERVQVPPADEELVENLKNEGFRISPIAEETSFLQVSLSKSRTNIQAGDFEKLLPLSDQITWLDLSRTEVGDSDLERLSEFKNLTRLSLQHTAVTDSTLEAIGSLEHLEYVNLYGTNITDRGLDHLQSITSLKSLYLWQTEVSGEAVERLKNKLTSVHINAGINTGNETRNQE